MHMSFVSVFSVLYSMGAESAPRILALTHQQAEDSRLWQGFNPAEVASNYGDTLTIWDYKEVRYWLIRPELNSLGPSQTLPGRHAGLLALKDMVDERCPVRLVLGELQSAAHGKNTCTALHFVPAAAEEEGAGAQAGRGRSHPPGVPLPAQPCRGARLRGRCPVVQHHPHHQGAEPEGRLHSRCIQGPGLSKAQLDKKLQGLWIVGGDGGTHA